MALVVQDASKDSYVYVLKKLEKIVSAVFLVTDLFSEKESLKNKLRDVSLNILSSASHDRSLESIKPFLIEFLSLLDVAYHSNNLSEMNYSVLKKESNDLIEKIQKDNSLNQSFFYTPENENVHDNKTASYRQPKPKRQSVTKSSKQSSKKKDRQNKIIEIIKDKKKVGVSDISGHITGVSDKTIQRELLELVDKGVLKKEGERRWSVYMLA